MQLHTTELLLPQIPYKKKQSTIYYRQLPCSFQNKQLDTSTLPSVITIYNTAHESRGLSFGYEQLPNLKFHVKF